MSRTVFTSVALTAAALVQAQTPGQPVRLKLVDVAAAVVSAVTSPGNAATVNSSFTDTGFVVQGAYTNPGGSANYRFSFNLNNPVFTRIVVGSGPNSFAILTPSPVFSGSIGTSNPSRFFVNATLDDDGYALNNGCTRNIRVPATGELSFSDCELLRLRNATFAGRPHVEVRHELRLSGGGTQGSATIRIIETFSYLEPQPTDSLEIVSGSVSPDPAVLRGDRVTFSARAKYTFNSFASAWVAMQLWDQPTGGTMLASSDQVAATRPTGENVLTIRDFAVTASTPATVYLRCVLINRATEAVALRTPNVVFAKSPRISVAPGTLSVTGMERGKATAGSANLDIGNAGGGTLDWRVSSPVSLSPRGEAAGTVQIRLNPAQATGVQSGRSGRVAVEIDTSQVTRAGTFTGTLTIESPVADNVSVPVEAGVTEPAGQDQISLSNAVPAAGTLAAGSSGRFSGVARYTLASAASGVVTLELFDGNTLLLASAAVSVNRGSSELSLTTPEFTLPAGVTRLTLKAVLRAGTTVVESSPIAYTVAGRPTFKIEIDYVSEVVIAGVENRFEAAAWYEMSGPGRAKAVFVLTGPAGAGPWRAERTGLAAASASDLASARVAFPPVVVPQPAPLTLSASLVDESSGAVLATSEPYPVLVIPAPTVGFELGWEDTRTQRFDRLDDPESIALQSPTLLAGWPFRPNRWRPAARVTWEGLDVAEAYVNATVRGLTGAPERVLTGSEVLRRGNGERIVALPEGRLNLAASVEFIAGIHPGVAPYRRFGSSPFVSAPFNIPVGFSIIVDSGGTPKSLQTGALAQRFLYIVKFEGASQDQVELVRIVEIKPDSASPAGGSRIDPVASPRGREIADEFTLRLGPETKIVTVTYALRRVRDGSELARSSPIEYLDFDSPGATVRRGEDASIDAGGGGRIANARTTGADKVVKPATLGKAWDDLVRATDPQIKTPGKSAVALLGPPELLAIRRTWTFSPAIPADGTFSGDLILPYDPAEFPDHPDFDEARLRIISIDSATRQVRVLPTTLDRASRTATTRLDQLASAYSLAVPGPYDNAVLRSPVSIPSGPGQTLVLLNTGETPASARVGDTARALAVPASGQMVTPLTAEDGSGVEARTSAKTAGIALLGGSGPGGSGLESVDLIQSTATVVVLPDILRAATGVTEVHLANASNSALEARLGLWNGDGSAAGVATLTLDPKARLVERVDVLFPDIPAEFAGYITADLDAGISAAALVRRGTSSVSVLLAQPVPAPSRTTTRLYAPYLSLGRSAPVTILNLVNPANLDASATVTALGPNGVALAPPVDVRLPGGKQERRSVSSLLGLDPSAAVLGSIRVDSTIRGVVGNVVIEGPLAGTFYRTTVPLDLEPSRTWLIPYASNAAGLASVLMMHNAGSAAANTQIRVTGPDGTVLGSAPALIPGNGSRSDVLATLVPGSAARTGYVTVTSDQPVIPLVLLGRADGSGDIAAILPRPVPGSSGPATPPVTPPGPPPVTASPLEFGSVIVGQTRDLALAVRNDGSASLTIRSYTLSNARFTVVSPAAPFTVAAGGTQSVTVRFAPTAVGAQSGTLTLASDDPAQPSVAVPLTGSGAEAPPAGAARIDAAPASVAFGSIAPGAQTTQPLTIRNTGTGPLTITALTIASPEFQLVGITAPVTIPPGSSVSWTLRFSPATAGSYSSALVIASNDPANPSFRVALTGTAAGAAQAPRIRVSESSLDFGTVRVGEPVDQTVVISNTGNAPLEVQAIESDNGRFSIPGSRSFTLPPATVFDLRIVFTANSPGPQAGTITIRSNDPGSPTKIPVSGVGR